MSDFDDFQSRVDQLNAEADADIQSDRTRRGHATTPGGILGTLGGAFLRGLMDSIGWMVGWVIFAGLCVGGLALYMGISFQAALLMVGAILLLIGAAAVFTR